MKSIEVRVVGSVEPPKIDISVVSVTHHSVIEKAIESFFLNDCQGFGKDVVSLKSLSFVAVSLKWSIYNLQSFIITNLNTDDNNGLFLHKKCKEMGENGLTLFLRGHDYCSLKYSEWKLLISYFLQHSR